MIVQKKKKKIFSMPDLSAAKIFSINSKGFISTHLWFSSQKKPESVSFNFGDLKYFSLIANPDIYSSGTFYMIIIKNLMLRI